MRRIRLAGIFLVVVIALNLLTYLNTKHVFEQLVIKLESSMDYVAHGDYESAKKALEAYENTFKRNEAFLILTVPKRLLFEAEVISTTMEAYINSDNKNDLLVDAARSVQQLENTWQTMNKLI